MGPADKPFLEERLAAGREEVGAARHCYERAYTERVMPPSMRMFCPVM